MMDEVVMKLEKVADAIIDNNDIVRELMQLQAAQHNEFLSYLEKRDRNHAELEEIDLRHRRLAFALDGPVQEAVIALRTEDDVKLAAFALYTAQTAEYKRTLQDNKRATELASINKEAADLLLRLAAKAPEESK